MYFIFSILSPSKRNLSTITSFSLHEENIFIFKIIIKFLSKATDSLSILICLSLECTFLHLINTEEYLHTYFSESLKLIFTAISHEINDEELSRRKNKNKKKSKNPRIVRNSIFWEIDVNEHQVEQKRLGNDANW